MQTYANQISLPTDATDPASPVRLSQVTAHIEDAALHLPTGGVTGQVLVLTADGPAWRYPVITSDGNGGYTITFSEDMQE